MATNKYITLDNLSTFKTKYDEQVNSQIGDKQDKLTFNKTDLKPECEYDEWVSKTWNGLTNFTAAFVWTDGDNIYYSGGESNYQYVLNKSTSTWTSKSWGGLRFTGEDIWTDGDNIYLSRSNSPSNPGLQYVLNKATNTWVSKTWYGLTDFSGYSVWTDGVDIYYSLNGNNYVLDKSTSTWSVKLWGGLTNFFGTAVWTDGENIYYSHSNSNSQYVLDKTTSTWVEKTWYGANELDATGIWTDGKDIYYSYSQYGRQYRYVLNKLTSTWEEKEWKGLEYFTGSHLWTDGESIYYSNNTYHYVLKRNNLNIQNQLSKKANVKDVNTLKALIDNKQDKLPTIVNDKYLHTNASTGALEWSSITSGNDPRIGYVTTNTPVYEQGQIVGYTITPSDWSQFEKEVCFVYANGGYGGLFITRDGALSQETVPKRTLESIYLMSGGVSGVYGLHQPKLVYSYYSTTLALSIDTLVNMGTKQDTLVSGTNIKTINNTSILGSGNLDTKELFYCTYGTTTYAEITSALSDGKLPVCFYNNIEYIYVGLSSTNRYTFSSQLFDSNRYVSVNSSDSWGIGSNNFEIVSNKVTSISSASTDSQYPSAKLLYDQLLLKQDKLYNYEEDFGEVEISTGDTSGEYIGSTISLESQKVNLKAKSVQQPGGSQERIDEASIDIDSNMSSVITLNADNIKFGTRDVSVLKNSSNLTDKYLHTNSTTGALEWSSVSGGGIPTVVIALSQVVSQTPLEVQLTNDQYNVFANNKQVLIDLSALGETSVVWNYYNDDSSVIYYGSADYGVACDYYKIDIDKTTKIATYSNGGKDISPIQVGSGNSADEGKLLAMNNSGNGILTNNLPILTTAPTSDNTSGGLILVVLNSQPSDYYDGYYYIITEA